MSLSKEKGQGTYDGSNGEPYWIVEWANGQYDTLWLLTDSWTESKRVEVERRFFGSGPLLDSIIRNLAVNNSRVKLEAEIRLYQVLSTVTETTLTR